MIEKFEGNYQLTIIRGATTAKDNSVKEIESAVVELIEELITRNNIVVNNLLSVIFTVTNDLDACFPASIARKSKSLDSVAFLDCQQMYVPNDVDFCIRLMAQVLLPADQSVNHPYLRVNELIIQRINEKYKDVNWEILSEENVKIDSENKDTNADWMWVLDPLDGTKDFIQGTSNYAMHLALNYKNKPYIGIVLIPEKDQLWISNVEKVWGEKRDGSLIKFNPPNNKNLKEMVLVTSKNHRNETLKNLIQKIHFKEVIIMGSIGCKITSIIRGESDIYICLSLPGKTSPKDWDFAAPEAILKAYGGSITNLDNKELSYGKSNFEQGGIIVASNNKLRHKKLCLELKQIIKKYNLYPL